MHVCAYISVFGAVAIASVAILSVCWLWLRYWHGDKDTYFFDPQDCAQHYADHPEENEKEKREFPLAASTTTFEPMLKHYIGVTQILITVAAASIAFGGDRASPPVRLIVVAKSFLAWSILYGLLFCAFVLYRYDEYTQDLNSYTAKWYATVEAFGFSALICFALGYLFWSWGLSK